MTQRRPHAPRHDADHLTSRERELENIERTLVFMSDDPGLEGRIKVFEGARDADKTMFLRAVQKLAEERNFSTIWASAGDGVFLDFLLRECGRISGTWAESARQRFSDLLERTSKSFCDRDVEAAGIAESPAPRFRVSLSRQLQEVMSFVGEQERVVNSGAILLIDDVQDADAETLRALSYAWQQMQSESPDLPLMTICAGSANAQDIITDAVSIGERFEYTYLGN